VSPRPYRLGRRQRTVAKTRRRILEAARRLLVRPTFRGLALDEVARTARVTRVTIYNQFGTKLGLIEALFRDTGTRIGVPDVVAALAQPDPRDALFALIRYSCRAWSRERVVLARLVALAAIDPDAGEVLAHFEGRRTHDAAMLASRLAASRMLAAGVDAREATLAIATLTSFQLYDLLAPRAEPVLRRMAAGLLR